MPSSAATWSRKASTWASSETSATNVVSRVPAGASFSASDTVSAIVSSLMSHRATWQPSADSWRTSSRPMPVPPPVTTAMRSVNCSICPPADVRAAGIDRLDRAVKDPIAVPCAAMTEVQARPPGVEPESPPVLEEAPDRRWWVLTAPRLALLSGLLYLPFTLLGYGTDVDITNVLRSGESLLDGDYRYSRPPGALPYEALVGVLDRIGGPTAVNLASTAMAVTLLALLARLVSDELGDRRARIAVVVMATQPWFWLAATSLGDYVFALGLLLAGVLAARHDRRVLAGLAFATAIAFRSSTAFLVWAYLFAELIGSRGGLEGDVRPRRGPGGATPSSPVPSRPPPGCCGSCRRGCPSGAPARSWSTSSRPPASSPWSGDGA